MTRHVYLLVIEVLQYFQNNKYARHRGVFHHPIQKFVFEHLHQHDRVFIHSKQVCTRALIASHLHNKCNFCIL